MIKTVIDKRGRGQCKDMATPHKEPEDARPIPIRRTNPLDLRPAFANDCTVSHSGAEFYITFGQIEPPLVLSVDDVGRLESVDSVTVAKLAVTPQFMEILVRALSENLEKFKEKQP